MAEAHMRARGWPFAKCDVVQRTTPPVAYTGFVTGRARCHSEGSPKSTVATQPIAVIDRIEAYRSGREVRQWENDA